MKYSPIITKGVLIASTLLAGGCGEEFVELSSPTAVRQDQYFTSADDIRAALNGSYGGLRSYYDNFYIMAEVPSDNVEANLATDISVGDFDRFSWQPTNGTVNNRWSASYTIISNSNILLEKIEPVAMDEALKERYKAEAKFLRALMYFNLVRFFGDVPLVLTEIKSEPEAYSYNREPVSNVYAQIEKDLQEAATVLPVRYTGSDAGMATSGAAKSLLGKAYLTNKQYSQAATILKEVIDANVYQLLPVYADVFRANNGNNAEIIFSVQYTRSGSKEGSNFAISFAPQGSNNEIVTGGSPGGLNQGTLDLFNAFEGGDLRKDVSIQRYTGGSRPYYTRKFIDQPPTTFEGDNDWPVLRYSDVLLLYAEALNAVEQTTEAEKYLNQVRKRAGLAPKTGLPQSDFQLAIEQERRLELCFEGHRWFDLVRTGRMTEVMNAYITRYRTTGGYLVGNYQLTPNKVLYPVPFRELSLNTNLGQNPGY